MAGHTLHRESECILGEEGGKGSEKGSNKARRVANDREKMHRINHSTSVVSHDLEHMSVCQDHRAHMDASRLLDVHVSTCTAMEKWQGRQEKKKSREKSKENTTYPSLLLGQSA